MDGNSCNFVGRLVSDPKYFPPEGEKIGRTWFKLAVGRPGQKDAAGKNITDFIPVVVFGSRAAAVAEHCQKGREVFVTGSLHENSSPVLNAAGEHCVHPVTGKPLYDTYFEVAAQMVSFGRRSSKEQTTAGVTAAPAATPAPGVPEVSSDLLAAVTAGVMAKLSEAQSAPTAVDEAANPLG